MICTKAAHLYTVYFAGPIRVRVGPGYMILSAGGKYLHIINILQLFGYHTAMIFGAAVNFQTIKLYYKRDLFFQNDIILGINIEFAAKLAIT